jgi:heterodisulfide reductase subunit C
MTEAVKTFSPSEAELRAAFWEQVDSFPDGHKIKKCLQCGTCTGACPVSEFMDITPRQTVAMFRAGRLDDILRSKTIWMCASCYACTVRCPSGIKVTDTMYALKRLALQRKIFPPNFPVHTLSSTFMQNVYKYGRNYELGLGVKYLLRSDFVKLFTIAGYGLSLIRRGRMGLLPKRIKRINQIQAIIKKANEFGEH